MRRAGFFTDVYHFYRYGCCWPYSLSFFLVLAIYFLDFFVGNARHHWASLAAYGIILGYYLYSYKGALCARDSRFFVRFLTFKISLWGIILSRPRNRALKGAENIGGRSSIPPLVPRALARAGSILIALCIGKR